MEKGNENVLRKEKEKATRPNGLETTPSKKIHNMLGRPGSISILFNLKFLMDLHWLRSLLWPGRESKVL